MTTIETRAKVSAAIIAALDPFGLAAEIGIPVDKWVNRCHEVSLALLKTGRFGHGRIARGWAKMITHQHSWIVLGDDVYAKDAVIVDATNPVFHNLWNASGRKTSPILAAARGTGTTHVPHGYGDIWQAGRPVCGDGPVVKLTPKVPLSDLAKAFLRADVLGPMDRHGWAQLANGPMQGWPASEIIAAMADTEEVAQLVPIDILGMLTDRNPGGLYLASEEAGE